MKIKRIYTLITSNLLMNLLILLAGLTSLISCPNVGYINWKVIALLFNLMIIVAVFQRTNVLDYIAIRLLNLCKNETSLTVMLVISCAVFSIFLTNDVALISFVPMTILLSLKIPINTSRLIILQTLAANLGSSLTPFGNPQNLFLYFHYHYHILNFIATTSFILILGAIFISIMIAKHKNNCSYFDLNFELPKIHMVKRVFLFVVLFVLVILSVLNLINYQVVTILILLVSIVLTPFVFKKIDYQLLIIFITFFIVVGNISNSPLIINIMQNLLNNSIATFWISIAISQIISNVPASILLANFTNCKTALLLGVNIGGLGTLIASMASLISYRFYIKAHPHNKKSYIKLFTQYNLLGLFFISLAGYIFIAIF